METTADSLDPTSLSPLAQDWYSKGRSLQVPGTANTRIWRQGSGPAVVCLNGVPASAFLYRKVLPELANRGLEGIALDYPGLGFADRPLDFDYSWTGLSGWLEKAIDAAGIETFHLVGHDLGGPIGFDLVRRNPSRFLSITVLNTLVKAASFVMPWVMRPFTVPVLSRLWIFQLETPGIIPFFRWKGVSSGPSNTEIRVYGELLTLGDKGRAFQKIMASFETTAEFEERILPPLADRKFPAQVIWGRYDTELPARTMGANVKQALRLEKDIHLVEGKHFIPEDSPVEIAERIATLVEAGHDI